MYTQIFDPQLYCQLNRPKFRKKSVRFHDFAVELLTSRPIDMPHQNIAIRTYTKLYDGPSLLNQKYANLVMYWIHAAYPTPKLLQQLSILEVPKIKAKILDLMQRLAQSLNGRALLVPQGGFKGTTIQTTHIPKLYQLVQTLPK
jgi:hypothetical protein